MVCFLWCSWFFIYMIAFNQGCETINASTSSVIIATVPIITALLARFIIHEKLKYFQWIAIMIEFSGVIVLTLIGGIFTMNKGIFWLLLAAVALSSYNLLLRKLTKNYSALQTSTFSVFTGTMLLTIFLPNSISEVSNAPAIQLFYVILLGIFSSAIAYVAWSTAFEKAQRTSTVSNYMFITPFLTSLLGFLITHEIPDIQTVIGGMIILFGLFIFNFGDKLHSRNIIMKKKL